MECLHLWELPCDVSIKIEPRFLEKIRERLKIKYGSWGAAYLELAPAMSRDAFEDVFAPSFKNYRPARLFLKACKSTGIRLSRLEKNVLSYRSIRGRVEIEEAKLPIEISPIFDMLVAHIFGDGCCRKDGEREFSMNYRQYDPALLSNFIRKTEMIFGKLKFKKEYFFSAKRFYLPSVCSAALANQYKLEAENFLSHKATIPPAIFTKPKMHLVAFLTAFVIDEAAIDSSIVITLCNKRLIDDLGRLCGILGYTYTIRGKTLYILTEGTRTFWKDYMQLKRIYPSANMGYRETAIQDFILRREKKLRTEGVGNRINDIVGLLGEKRRTVNELSKILRVSRQGIKFHIKRLEQEGVAEMIGEGRAGGFIYKLNRKKQYAAIRRGESHQIGKTEEQLLRFLAKKPRTSVELSKRLGISISAAQNALRKLAAKNKAKIFSKVVLKTHPAYVWGPCHGD